MGLPKPRYTWAEALQTAIALSARAIEEVRALKREPGPRGADGFGFEHMSERVDPEDERTIVRSYKRGDEVVEFRHTFPMMIYRGVWREGSNYVRGDTVTLHGHLFHCDAPTSDKPLEHGKGNWTLCTKRGGEGKEGRPGIAGKDGKDGKDGRDLTSILPDGTKY